jgi:regulator of sigma E protease
MQSFLFAIVSVSIVLGIMILVHEWGHFVAAKLFGVRVETFSIGFGTRLWGWKRGDTDYRVSVLPFGGYVKMAGDNPLEERTGAKDEFLSKTRWQRVVIAVAGPAMNALLTFFIFWGVAWLYGTPYPAYFKQPADVAAVSLSAASSGVEAGDRIEKLNGVATPTWERVYEEASKAKPGAPTSVVVERAGHEETLSLVMNDAGAPPILGFPAESPLVDTVDPASPAGKAGLKQGDLIVAMNGKPIVAFEQLVEVVRGSNGNPLSVTVRRDGKEVSFEITPVLGLTPDAQRVWLIGVARGLDKLRERMGFFTAAHEAGLQTLAVTTQIGGVLGGLFSGRVSVRELQGVVGIARVSGQAAKQGLMSLLEVMAVISLNLALLNLLPIPILDGGHILMLTIEGLMQRDLSVAVKERFVQVGLVFLLGIFAFVMYSDILRLIQSH